MQSIVNKKTFICYKCLNILKSFNSKLTTKTPNIEIKQKVSQKSKTKTKLQLNAKQFPRLLKDLDKFDKTLSSKAKVSTDFIDISEDKGLDIISHYVESEANDEWIESEVDSKITNDWIESNEQCFGDNHYILSPESEDMNEIIESIDEIETEVKKKSTSKTKPSKVSKRHEDLRQQMREIDNKSKAYSLRRSLKSYIHSCIYADMISKAHSVLLYYRNRNRSKGNTTSEDINPIDVSVYNVLLKGWAQRGKTLRIKELLNSMKKSNIRPNPESFAYYLLSYGRQTQKPVNEEIVLVINEMKSFALKPEQLFNNCFISKEEKNIILKLLGNCLPKITTNAVRFPEEYSISLMKPFETMDQKHYNPSEGVDLGDLEASAKQQFSLEINGNIIIKSIIGDDLSETNDKIKKFLKNQWKKTEKEWRISLREVFLRLTKTLQIQSNEINGMTLYPYLVVLDTQYYIDAVVEEIRSCANMSVYYSPPMSTLYSALGRRIMLRYLVKTHIRDGTAQDFQELYDKYLEYYKCPELTTKYKPREYWHKLMAQNQHFYNDNSRDKIWPYHVQVGVGQFLYNLMVQEIKIDTNIMKSNANCKRKVPAFGIAYKPIGNLRYQKEFRVHPTLSKLYRKTCLDSLLFDINMLPMLCPPTPWISPKFGGFLLTKTEFVRMPDTYQKWIYNSYNTQTLYPCFDSLNYLSMSPWIVNTSVLDVAIHYFKNSGNLSLSIPKPLSEYPSLPKVEPVMSRTEKVKVYRQRSQQKREMSEMYSLWCDCLYKLSIANHFRNKVFWFPNNLDFRGRVYPVPPHFNHLGNDLTRSLMLFAKGQPLGDNGLNWLKIHLINLTGLKKRSPLSERLAFADEIMPLILDSADNPMNGCKWWTESDDPWQTLACCVEIAKAVRSPDPKLYICHFPIHQDGSCNGLQHYAALGRDQSGAESVNLHPADRPQDVYSDVAALVEKQRVREALEGNEIAKSLEGFVGRKIVKRTVMTYVYGVTRFGAKLQIFKALKETETFPKDKAFSAAIYLTQKTFLSIQQMFTETRCIQDWLTDCARIISKVYEKPVEWVTPIGFPVVQPYFKPKTKIGETFLGIGSETTLRYLSRSDSFQKPNSLKQKNAFPPNFIHSLDSTHMMLTSFQCHKEGLTYASVHDCFWTHPNCVELMNRFCRQQFIALHNEPILDQLSQHFIEVYVGMASNANKNDMKKATDLLSKRLKKGSFVLESVNESMYFFS